MTISKEQIIKYFKSGIKEKKDFKIGIEHEKFLFDSKNNKRIDYLYFFVILIFNLLNFN